MQCRIRVISYTDQNVHTKVEIWDNDYTGSVVTTINDNGYELEYDRADRFLSPLIPSSCYYQLLDDGSSDFNSFKADISTAQENEFKLVIYTDPTNTNTWVIRWAGIIMTDTISWDDNITPRTFEIVAKDGINRLENIYFDKILSSPYTSDPLQTVKKIVFDCLSYSDTAQFWNGSTKPYITCDLQWHDTQQTGITQAKILDLIYIGREFLIDDRNFKGDQPYIKFRGDDDPPLKAKKVLYDILQILGVRLLLSDGSWHIQQVSQQVNNTNTIGYYDYLGAYQGSASVQTKLTENGSTLAILTGGKYAYYPSVKSTKAQVYPSDILRGAFNIESPINKDHLTFTSSTFKLGTIYGGSGVGIKLQLEVFYKIIEWFSGIGTDWYVEVNVVLEADNYRIKQKVNNTIPYFQTSEALWTTTAADKYIVFVNDFNPAFVINNEYKSFTLLTEEIPFTKKDNCTVYVQATLKSVSGATNYPPLQYFNLFFQNIRISLLDSLADPPVYSQITELEKLNGLNPSVTNNSIEIDYGLLRISDTLGNTNAPSLNTIMVVAPNDGSGTKTASTWVAGHTTDEHLVSTLLTETIALQKQPIKKYVGNFRSTIYHAWNTILYDSEIWVFMGGRYSSKMDLWNGEWFGISVDLSASVSQATYKIPLQGYVVTPVAEKKYFDPTLFNPVGTPMATINGKTDVGTLITSLGIQALTQRLVRKDDTIWALNSSQLNKVQEFTVDDDAEIGDTTLTISSATTLVDLWQSFLLIFDPSKIKAADIIRGNKFQLQEYSEQGIKNGFNQTWNLKYQTSGNSTTTLTTDGNAVSGTTNIVPIPLDCAVSGFMQLNCKISGSAYSASVLRQFAGVNSSGTTSMTGTLITVGTDILGGALSGIMVDVVFDNSDDTIKVKVNGLTATNIRWTAKLDLVFTKYT